MGSDDRPRRVPVSGGSVSFASIISLLAENADADADPTSLAPTSGRVVEEADSEDVYVGNGDSWLDADHQLGMDLSGLPGVQIVRSADDLPAPSGGFHTLEDKIYQFVGEVESDAGLELADSSPLLGHHREHCWFVRTGGGTAIKGSGDVVVNQLGLSAPGGTLLDVGGDATSELLMDHVYFAVDESLSASGTINDLGTIGTFRGPEMRVAGIRDFDSGLTLDGTYNRLYIESKVRAVDASNVTVFSLGPNFHSSSAEVTNTDISNVQSDTEVLNTDAGAVIDEGLIYRGNTHDSTVTKDNILTGALDEDSVGVDVKSSWPLADSAPSASYSKDGSTVTTISAQDPGDGSEAVKIGGSSTVFASTTNRFTHTSPNRITYDGKRDYRAMAHATVSVSGSNTTVAVYFAKNGSVLQRSGIEITTASAGQPRTATLTTRVPLVTDDHLEVWLANEGGTGDITVSTLEVTI